MRRHKQREDEHEHELYKAVEQPGNAQAMHDTG